MTNRPSPYIDRATSDGIWIGGGSSWMYRVLPVRSVFWQDGFEADKFTHILDRTAASLHDSLLDDSAGREVQLLAIAHDDPAVTAVPQGVCVSCDTAGELDRTPPISTANRPRAAVFAVGVRLGAYGPPPERGTPLRRIHTALARRRAPASGRPVGRFYERIARAFDTWWYVASHPYHDPGADAVATALSKAGARQLDREQTDRLMGWPARAASFQDCIFIAAADGRSVEADAWGEDITSGCGHPLASGLQFCVVPIDAEPEELFGGEALIGAFAQRPGLVAVSVRAWLKSDGGTWLWSDISALAAFRTAERPAPELDSRLPQLRVASHRQMMAFDEMCPLSPRRGVYESGALV